MYKRQELLLQLLVGNVDQVMLSQYNTTAVAAVGNANQVITILILTFSVISLAAVSYTHLKVKFMFQPGEEGHGGGHKMVEAGVLENPHVDAAMGFHSFAGLDVPTGHVVYSPRPAMASCDMLPIPVTGKGAHGARPEAGCDPLNILCHIHGLSLIHI